MGNFYSLLKLLAVIMAIGTLTWISWDQIAYSMRWPRPQWGAGVGLVFLGVIANILWNNRLLIGRISANSDNGDPTETP